MRVPGEGAPSPQGGEHGDLYCFISVKRHRLFQRDGRNPILQMPISFTQAALGAKISVRTVDGTEEVEVPAGTQSGQEIRLRGQGMPRLRGSGRGDLHVLVTVVVPARLSRRERELIRELGEASSPAENRRVSPGSQKPINRPDSAKIVAKMAQSPACRMMSPTSICRRSTEAEVRLLNW